MRGTPYGYGFHEIRATSDEIRAPAAGAWYNGPMGKSVNPIDRFLPTTAEELRGRGWGQADVILVTGDAYVDHPSFGAALIGR